MITERIEQFSDRFVVLIGNPTSFQVCHFDLDERKQARQLFRAACQVAQVRAAWIDTADGRVLRQKRWSLPKRCAANAWKTPR